MTILPRIIITAGEPAGIGPDIVLQLIQQNWPAELIVIADPDLFIARAKQLNLPCESSMINSNQLQNLPKPHRAQQLKMLPIALKQNVKAGELNAANAWYVIETLKLAATLCLEKKANALVTGPVHKAILNSAGILFSGHTEFFAELCDVKQTIMLFVVDQLKVALVTTHLPLAQVPAAITHEHLENTIVLLQKELRRQFNLETPRILICGLNPHAGESGYLGREEIEIMLPIIKKLREKNYRLEGPLPADTLFTPKYLQQADAVLAMYHDQALPLVKYIGFGHAVNVTLGLPFIRTSVDHGTALDLAGSGQADAGSMMAAIELAISVAKQPWLSD